jgi:hypothetical protein
MIDDSLGKFNDRFMYFETPSALRVRNFNYDIVPIYVSLCTSMQIKAK